MCCNSVAASVLHVCGNLGMGSVAACRPLGWAACVLLDGSPCATGLAAHLLQVWQPMCCMLGSPCAACVAACALQVHVGQPVCCMSGSLGATLVAAACVGSLCATGMAAHVLPLCCMYGSLYRTVTLFHNMYLHIHGMYAISMAVENMFLELMVLHSRHLAPGLAIVCH